MFAQATYQLSIDSEFLHEFTKNPIQALATRGLELGRDEIDALLETLKRPLQYTTDGPTWF
jgi:hypothetical protein